MRVLGVHIAHGFSSEARVFAEWLGQRSGQYDPLVLFQASKGEPQSADKFRATSRATLQTIDTGWRPNPENKRSVLAKAASHARFRIALIEMLMRAKAFNPDVIFSNQQKWDCHAATFISKMLKIPHALLLCYPIGDSLGREVLTRIESCDHLIVIDEYARQDALQHGVPGERVTKVLPTIAAAPRVEPDTREAVRSELRIPADAQLIGIVARLDPQKGQADAIAAFAQVAARFPRAHLLLVGDSTTGETPRAVLERQAAQTGFGDRIIFEGWRTDLPRILAALDIFMHPARADTISLAPLEASASGLPVIAYAESGALEAVQDGTTGLLAPSGSIDGLAESLAQLLARPLDAQRMGDAGRTFVGDAFGRQRWGLAFADVLRNTANDVLRNTANIAPGESAKVATFSTHELMAEQDGAAL
ncbi:MAG: glycosyltransferase family 4 protein [Chloroflexota bacterium]